MIRIKNLNEPIIKKHVAFRERGTLKNDVLRGRVPNRKLYLPHIPKKLIKIVNKAMNVDVEQRYHTGLDIMNDISNVNECLDWTFSGIL